MSNTDTITFPTPFNSVVYINVISSATGNGYVLRTVNWTKTGFKIASDYFNSGVNPESNKHWYAIGY